MTALPSPCSLLPPCKSLIWSRNVISRIGPVIWIALYILARGETGASYNKNNAFQDCGWVSKPLTMCVFSKYLNITMVGYLLYSFTTIASSHIFGKLIFSPSQRGRKWRSYLEWQRWNGVWIFDFWVECRERLKHVQWLHLLHFMKNSNIMWINNISPSQWDTTWSCQLRRMYGAMIKQCHCHVIIVRNCVTIHMLYNIYGWVYLWYIPSFVCKLSVTIYPCGENPL